ncbi:2468_t:CDS:2, partial [Gigaspora rosea]
SEDFAGLDSLKIVMPLAWLTAQSHGFVEEAEAILTSARLTADDITDMPTNGQLLKPQRQFLNILILIKCRLKSF